MTEAGGCRWELMQQISRQGRESSRESSEVVSGDDDRQRGRESVCIVCEERERG
jgi:hypothetical protein